MSKSTSNLSKQMMSLAPDALIELYEIDFSILQENMEHFQDLEGLTYSSEPIYRFCSMTNGTNPIYWQGNGYQPLPIEANGFEKVGDGRLPRPKITIGNPNGLLSMIIKVNKDFSNCKVTRKRTYARFLDSDNFLNRNENESGENTFGVPDSDAHFPDDIFFINKKSLEANDLIEFELVSALELEDAKVPARVMLSSYCAWTYRCNIGCGYKGLPIETSSGKSLISGFATDASLNNLAKLDKNKNFDDILEWNRYGHLGTKDNLKGYNLGDIVKIVGKKSSNPYRIAPSVFVCVQSHEIAKNHHPFFDKKYWLKDECAKTLESCELRFGEALVDFNKSDKTHEGLRFGGFPGTEKFNVEG